MRKNILITGASSGLGEGMAREFAATGHDLALCARRIEQLQSLRTDLKSEFPSIRIEVRSLDVNDHEQVFTVFRELDGALGGLDRVIVNAGIGEGAPIGTGGFAANCRTLETNVIAALAQCEAAVELFRQRNAGHLVVISSVSAFRGAKSRMTAYAASKAGVATLAEGIRLELRNTPIRVTTLFPGYILTPINAAVKNAPFRVGVVAGCRALVKAIDREVAEACVPAWPWGVISRALRYLPDRLLVKVM